MGHFDEELRKIARECDRVESYLDKYINIRIQNIVATTLRACLTGEARRNHELYDLDKMHLLFKAIIDEDGQPGDLERMILDLNAEAKKRVEAMQEMKERMHRKMSSAIVRTARKMNSKQRAQKSPGEEELSYPSLTQSSPQCQSKHDFTDSASIQIEPVGKGHKK